MKTLVSTAIIVLTCILVNAQDQFTNFGNFQTFSGASITFFGNFANNGTFVDAQAVTFKGAANQNISGTSITTFFNLVSNSAVGITLQQDVVIGNSLTLTTGSLNLNSRTLTINNSASTAMSRTSGYILSEQTNNSGKVKWNIGSNTSSHVFSFGTVSAVYIPFTLAVTGGNIGNVTVSTYPTAANNLPLPTTPMAVTNVNRYGSNNSADVVDRFWQIDKDGVSGTATLSFNASPSEVGTITTLLAQRWNSSTSTWDDPLAGQSATATGVTVSGVSAFSPWTLSGNNRPLPIKLLSFTATPLNNDVVLDWKTATEIGNDYFTIQRSANGLEFSDIAKVDAGLASETLQKYNYVDAAALSGRSYYRLMQTDFDAAFKFSEVVRVDLNLTAARVTVFPNPTTNSEFSLNFHNRTETATSITIYDLLGREVFSEVVSPGALLHTIRLVDSPAGVYMIQTVNTAYSSQRVVLK